MPVTSRSCGCKIQVAALLRLGNKQALDEIQSRKSKDSECGRGAVKGSLAKYVTFKQRHKDMREGALAVSGGRGSRKGEQKCSSPKGGAGPGEPEGDGAGSSGERSRCGGGSFKWVLLWA